MLNLSAFQLSPLKDFKCHSVLDTESICVEKTNRLRIWSGVTVNGTVPSLIVRGQNFLKNVVNLEILERVFNAGFTLAEVLITLGIIGVVAAMTIPGLITKCEQIRTETRLKKFYSMINQTVRMSSADNGEPEGWGLYDGKEHDYRYHLNILNQYFLPYMKYTKVENCKTDPMNPYTACVYFLDGSAMRVKFDHFGGTINYFIDGDSSRRIAKNWFYFEFHMVSDEYSRTVGNNKNYVVPRTWGEGMGKVPKTVSECMNKGCNKNKILFCTKCIELNSWKIPENYPWNSSLK